VNAVPGMGQPLPGTGSSYNASRRKFLKGVGLAAAAGLAAPLLTSTSAHAAVEGIVLGVNAGPWDPAPPTESWPSAVPGALGCRSYRDTPFSTGPDCPTAFPGEAGSKAVASIRPDPTVLLNPADPNYDGLVQALQALILDGATKASTGYFAAPELTVWHEAGNMYTDQSTYLQYGVVPGTYTTINGTSLSAAQIMRSTHVQMQSLCDQVASANPGLPAVKYGCIIYGDIAQMASDTDSTLDWVPTSSYPLDWYGVDVYYEGDGPGSTSTHPDLSSYDLVSQYMGGFLTMAQERSGLTWPQINVCECNADAADDSARPQFFENLALWLYNNGGRRMLTFFPDTAGPHSVTWEYVVDAAVPYTINALNSIQSNYG